MEMCDQFRYPEVHETSRHASATGEAPPTRRPVAPSWQDAVGRGPGSERLGELGLSLVAGLPHARRAGVARQADPGAPTPALATAETETGAAAAPRPARGGLPYRSLDPPARGGPDRARVRRGVPP